MGTICPVYEPRVKICTMETYTKTLNYVGVPEKNELQKSIRSDWLTKSEIEQAVEISGTGLRQQVLSTKRRLNP